MTEPVTVHQCSCNANELLGGQKRVTLYWPVCALSFAACPHDAVVTYGGRSNAPASISGSGSAGVNVMRGSYL
jgi:hypothetical protein